MVAFVTLLEGDWLTYGIDDLEDYSRKHTYPQNGPLLHVALHRAGLTGVLAGGDYHVVAAPSHPSHAPDGRE